MRKVAVLLALAGMSLAALAAKRLTVADLEQELAKARGVPDASLAQQLSDLELTERLSTTTLARLKTALTGEKSSEELTILADQSSFLTVPAAEIHSTPPPDAGAQRKIMASVVDYVTKITHQLPNFVADRETRSFEDRPAVLYSYLPLRLTGHTTASVIYENGREVDTVLAKGKKTAPAAPGLVSWGEFGPILSTVLLDAAQSELAWSHWEQNTGAKVAVFRYSVPAKKSHYRVQFCCVSDDPLVTSEPLPGNVHIYHELAPYQGELAVDASSGAILRVTVVADLAPGSPLITASIVVEYGPVEIGGKKYICPTKGVAVAQRHVFTPALGARPAAPMNRSPIVTRMNETSFTHYHVFRGDSRILTAEESEQAGEVSLKAQSNASGQASLAANTGQTATVEGSAGDPSQGMQPAQADAGGGDNTAPQATHAESPASIATNDAAASAATTPPPTVHDIPQTPIYRSTTREVVVDVVVTKTNGDPVAGLGKQDFAILEMASHRRSTSLKSIRQGIALQVRHPRCRNCLPACAPMFPRLRKATLSTFCCSIL